MTPELKAPTSSSIYIGYKRYSRVTQLAISTSAEVRVPVTASQFVQHLIDHYSDVAQANWAKTTVAASADDTTKD